MTTHAPGPWLVGSPNGEWNACDEESSCSEWLGITDSRGDAIALAVASSDDYFSDGRVSANASLIASAPDLLGQHEADLVDLELLLRAIKEGDPTSELEIRVQDIIRNKEAAIAKATGAEA